MDVKEFIAHLEEAIETLEERLDYNGPYTDSFEVDDDVFEVFFEEGQRFRLTVEKIV